MRPFVEAARKKKFHHPFVEAEKFHQVAAAEREEEKKKWRSLAGGGGEGSSRISSRATVVEQDSIDTAPRSSYSPLLEARALVVPTAESSHQKKKKKLSKPLAMGAAGFPLLLEEVL